MVIEELTIAAWADRCWRPEAVDGAPFASGPLVTVNRTGWPTTRVFQFKRSSGWGRSVTFRQIRC
jgi:hypothetical protein